jgi:predicted anti-sigma-YlaC factor YlaD
MLCKEFEDHLSDYLDGLLEGETLNSFNKHTMRCPICHDLLNEVRTTINACRDSIPPPPPHTLEANILLRTAPETSVMTCEEFEDHLTDYLDGFLAAPLYQRWSRHAALCDQCTDLPGQVVRSIGACYSYMKTEMEVPVGLHEKILQSTIGTTNAHEVRAPLKARMAAWVRTTLDGFLMPQFATVATMFLVAMLIGTNTISEDGSIGGMYRASLRLAAQTYEVMVDQGDNLQVAQP